MAIMTKLLPVDGGSPFSREEARVLRDSLSRFFDKEEPQFVR